MPQCKSASVIINGHREGRLLGYTLRSAIRAKHVAREAGLNISIYLILDNADEATEAVANSFASDLKKVIAVSYRNLGDSRQHGVRAAKDKWLFFLDGDDLVSENWFRDAMLKAASDKNSLKTVYHTELFVGFDAQVFYRRAMRTADPEFDPYGLICDWFFCNNLFVHRSILSDVNIEAYDHDAGFGAEDWHWSCQTTAKGYARDFVPQTTYFYRIKPAELSLGMASGLMHKKSELFSREYLDTFQKSEYGRRVGVFEAQGEPKLERFRQGVPEWLITQVESASLIESKIIEIGRFAFENPQLAKTFPPRLHYGAGLFYRSAIADFKPDGKKVALWWGKNSRNGKKRLVHDVISSLKDKFASDIQIILFSELDGFSNRAIQSGYDVENVKVVDLNEAVTRYDIPEHYLAITNMRFYVQFNFVQSVNVNSSVFLSAVKHYPKAMKTSCPDVLHLCIARDWDLSDVELSSWLTGMNSYSSLTNTLIVGSKRLADKFEDSAHFNLPFHVDETLETVLFDHLTLKGLETDNLEPGLPVISKKTLNAALSKTVKKAPSKTETASGKIYKRTIFTLAMQKGFDLQALVSSAEASEQSLTRIVVLSSKAMCKNLGINYTKAISSKTENLYSVVGYNNTFVKFVNGTDFPNYIKSMLELKTQSMALCTSSTIPSPNFFKKGFQYSSVKSPYFAFSEFGFSPRGDFWDISQRPAALVRGLDSEALIHISEHPFGAAIFNVAYLMAASKNCPEGFSHDEDVLILFLVAFAKQSNSLNVIPETTVLRSELRDLSVSSRSRLLRAMTPVSGSDAL